MSFKINPLYLSDGYKVGHKMMLAPGTTKLYGTWIPRSLKHAPKGIKKIVSFGQQFVWKYIHDAFDEHFFFTKERNVHGHYEGEEEFLANEELKKKALTFGKDISLYLGVKYNYTHFEELWELGYLPLKIKSLPEGIETDPQHSTYDIC